MKKFYLGIALTMALASCTQEELVNSTNESKLQVSVESNNTLSRVGFDKADNWSFFWITWGNDGAGRRQRYGVSLRSMKIPMFCSGCPVHMAVLFSIGYILQHLRSPCLSTRM